MSECRKATKVIVDNVAGDMVCTECGLDLEQHMIDESAEWRKFSNELPSNDPERVGVPYNPLLSDGGLETIISKRNGAQEDVMSRSARWQNRGSASDPDRWLILALGTTATMADRLALVSTVKDRANEIYKKVADLKIFRSKRRNQDAILAACLYIACRQEGKPRTFKELSSGADSASSQEIGEVSEIIMKQLTLEKGEPMEMGTIDARDFVRRFCSYLGLGHKAACATLEAVRKSDELDLRNAPLSIAAATIYMISQLSQEKQAVKDVSRYTGVAEVTIRKTYKQLYPHAARLIPEWFLKDTDIKNLPARA